MKCEAQSSECRTAKCGSAILLLALLCGCATQGQFVGSRPFDFHKDTFAYANELIWEYHFDANGKWLHQRREPPPDYTLHCFVLARAARQFFQNAKFDPRLPVADEAAYRGLIHRVVGTDPASVLPESKKIVIPGYADLHAFSEAQERLLKAECGGAWQSYFQRGNWRMIFPFSRASQERAAEQLLADVKANRPPIIHVVRFPQLKINHAMVIFATSETEREISFSTYDPNQPEAPRTLTFNRTDRTFSLAGNNYWPGGRVDVYEIYRSWNY